jgi:DNA-binding GntR family transcriptional regulator
MAAIERTDLANQVYNLLRHEIIRGAFDHGERLHVGRLADRFDVSPTPVKTAIARLASEGLVEMGNRRGAFVTRLTAADIDELAEVREMIEQFAGQRAIDRATTEDVDRLEALAKALLSHIHPDGSADYEAFATDDMTFHAELIGMCGNGHLSRLYDSLHVYSVVRRAHYVEHGQGLATSRPRTPYVHVHDEHMAIVAALRARDAEALRSAISEHLAIVREFAIRVLTTGNADDSGGS